MGMEVLLIDHHRPCCARMVRMMVNFFEKFNITVGSRVRIEECAKRGGSTGAVYGSGDVSYEIPLRDLWITVSS